MGSADDGEFSPSNYDFDVVRHGFDRTQVRRILASLEANLRQATADRHSAHSRAASLTDQLQAAQEEIGQLRDRVEQLSKPAEVAEDVHDRLRVMVDVTKAETAEIASRAQAVAEQTWTSTKDAASALRQRYDALLAELESQESELRTAHAAAMEHAAAEVKRIAEETQRRRVQLGELAEAEYQRIEREFHESMTLRRAALDSEIAERQEASVAEADRVLREATDAANRKSAWADGKVRELQAFRDSVAERVQQTSRLLEESSALLEPDATELEILTENSRSVGAEEAPDQPHSQAG
jgi:colicin import membrane protein